MSWSGFKKNVGRATTQVMMKTGHVEKTSDRGYEVEERRYRTLESASLRLQKEAKGYLDSLRAMTASQMRIAETIDAFYGDSGASDGVSRSYKQAVEDLDAETVKALDGPYRLVDIPSRDMCGSGKSRLYHYLVNEDSLLPYLVDHKTDGLDEELIAEVESEYYSTKRREGDEKRVVDIMEEFREEYELIESVCRTTVLEPINRFCAYFPDINECIKKRNHKMLDYDSMRSKVRRLTEKPDKDASKLPRAEKEADMVSLTNSLDEHRSPSPHASLAPSTKARMEKRALLERSRTGLFELEREAEKDLVMPVPSGMFPRLDIEKTREDGRPRRSSSGGSGWGSNLLARFAEMPSPIPETAIDHSTSCEDFKKARDEVEHTRIPQGDSSKSNAGASVDHKASSHQRSDSMRSSITLAPSITSSDSDANLAAFPAFNDADASSTDNLLPRSRTFSGTSSGRTARHVSPPPLSNSSKRHLIPSQNTIETPYGTLTINPLLQSNPSLPTLHSRTHASSPFLNPSDLEELMLPVKRAFLQQRTNELKQAKAAYEQLNEQLSTELPQIIDLRVPYLDPSFEALVKIQLRFCAEAYSRMAQVQQYLDPQTRDQYANGELDQRVEDVLGQIRELSIAGTV